MTENNNGSTEKILWFDRQILAQYSSANETLFKDDNLLQIILQNVHYSARKDVEEKNSLKQLVAYVLIKTGKLYLTYRRTNRSGEKNSGICVRLDSEGI